MLKLLLKQLEIRCLGQAAVQSYFPLNWFTYEWFMCDYMFLWATIKTGILVQAQFFSYRSCTYTHTQKKEYLKLIGRCIDRSRYHNGRWFSCFREEHRALSLRSRDPMRNSITGIHTYASSLRGSFGAGSTRCRWPLSQLLAADTSAGMWSQTQRTVDSTWLFKQPSSNSPK